MMEADYVTDVDYVDGFYEFQSPATLNWVALLNGFAPIPLDGEFSYCELGCGHGLTSTLLAASYPQAEFCALDINTTYVERAAARARAVGTDNLRFLALDAGDEASTAELPKFDFITLHGLYSWVGSEVRTRLRTFLRRQLKPGGMVMVSYNALPGWASLQPIREMAHAYAARVPGNSLDKGRHALTYLKFLADNKALYFEQNPLARSELDRFLNAEPNYVVHELMTTHGEPFYFSQVCDAMAEIGLSYAGDTRLRESFYEFMAPAEFLPLLKSAPTREVLEIHKDFIVNRRFRRDVYVAQPLAQKNMAQTRERFGAARLALVRLPEQLPETGEYDGLAYDLRPHMAEAGRITSALADGSLAMSELADRLQISDDQWPGLLNSVKQLMLTGLLQPAAPRIGVADRQRFDRLNAAMIDLAGRQQRTEVGLACSAYGGARGFSLGFALALQCSREFASVEEAAAAAAVRLAQLGMRLDIQDTAAPTSEQGVNFFKASIENIRAGTDGRLVALLGV